MDSKITIKVSMEEMQEWSARLTMLITFIGIFSFTYVWGFSDSLAALGDIHESFFEWLATFGLFTVLFLLALLIGSLLHELIHALFFMPFLPSGYKSLKFGYKKEYLALYVHLKEPISVKGFRIGGVMPGIILGILPMVVGLMYGYLSILLFGMFMTVAAVGDFLLLAKTMRLHSGYMIKDQPDDIAIVAIEKRRTGEIAV